VLCVEESRTIGDLQRIFLERAGYEVLVAQDGKAARQLLKSVGADVLVIDEHTASSMERWAGADRGLPVVLVFGSLEALAREEGGRIPAEGWLVRPYSQRQIVCAVETAFSAGASGAAPRQSCPPATQPPFVRRLVEKSTSAT
jgi:DNA-binding response OmpR family regulator